MNLKTDAELDNNKKGFNSRRKDFYNQLCVFDFFRYQKVFFLKNI